MGANEFQIRAEQASLSASKEVDDFEKLTSHAAIREKLRRIQNTADAAKKAATPQEAQLHAEATEQLLEELKQDVVRAQLAFCSTDETTREFVRTRYNETGNWSRHYSSVRATIATFFMTANVALLGALWKSPSTRIAFFLTTFFLLGMVLYVVFSRKTSAAMSEQKRLERDLLNGSQQPTPAARSRFFERHGVNYVLPAALLLGFSVLNLGWGLNWFGTPAQDTKAFLSTKIPVMVTRKDETPFQTDLPITIALPANLQSSEPVHSIYFGVNDTCEQWKTKRVFPDSLDEAMLDISVRNARKITVKGFADGTPSTKENKRLANDRAECVAALLKERFPTPQYVITTSSDDKQSKGPNARDRRADVQIEFPTAAVQ